MYERLIVGQRNVKPYLVSDKDIARLREKFNGKEKKVQAVVLLAQNNGYIKLEEVAFLCKITRMTLYRWRTQDEMFQKECDRLLDKASRHTRSEYDRIMRRRVYSIAELCGGWYGYRNLEDIIYDLP